MQRNMVRFIIISAMLGGVAARADKISFGEAPKAVQKAIGTLAQSKGEAFDSIDTQKKDGVTIYDVEFKRKGANEHIQFAENGSIVDGKHGGADVNNGAAQGAAPSAKQHATGEVRENSRGRTLSLDQVPAAVRQKITDNADDAGLLKSIKQERKNGVTSYTAEFEKKGRKNTRLKIAEDGLIIGDNRIK